MHKNNQKSLEKKSTMGEFLLPPIRIQFKVMTSVWVWYSVNEAE